LNKFLKKILRINLYKKYIVYKIKYTQLRNQEDILENDEEFSERYLMKERFMEISKFSISTRDVTGYPKPGLFSTRYPTRQFPDP